MVCYNAVGIFTRLLRYTAKELLEFSKKLSSIVHTGNYNRVNKQKLA